VVKHIRGPISLEQMRSIINDLLNE